MSEQQMTVLVGRLGGALQPDVAALVAGGTARGRARRRRRTIGSAAAGVAAIGVVALTAALFPRAANTGPVVTGPVSQSRHVAVLPPDMGAVLESLLPGARVVEGDEAPYRYQLQGGTVRWHGAAVTVTIDSRSVGTRSSARERCEAFMDAACSEGPGGAWVAEHGAVELDTRTGEPGPSLDLVRVYEPEGYVVEASGESGAPGTGRELLRRLALDDAWFD